MEVKARDASVYGYESTARECFDKMGKRQTNQTKLIFQTKWGYTGGRDYALTMSTSTWHASVYGYENTARKRLWM